MKKVWLEVTHILQNPSQSMTGIGYYTHQVVKNLVKLGGHDYSLVGSLFLTNSVSPIISKEINAPLRRFSLIPAKLWNQLVKLHLLPRLGWLYGGRPDAVVYFNFAYLPVDPKTKTLTTIHDLTFKVYPEFVATKNLWSLNRFVPDAAKHSTRIIAISEATKADIIHYFKVPAEAISVVYPGVNYELFRAGVCDDTIRQRYQLPDKYFLFMGTLEPRKNIDGIVRAYRLLPAAVQRECALVLCGGRGWNNASIVTEIQNYDGPGTIIETGRFRTEDMPGITKGATALVWPSHYEGFGIPIVQAMAAGVPVVTANNSSLAEIAGDAALLVDSRDDQALATAMKQVHTDPAVRRRLIAAGHKQARQFTWERSAQQLKQAIDLTLLGQ